MNSSAPGKTAAQRVLDCMRATNRDGDYRVTLRYGTQRLEVDDPVRHHAEFWFQMATAAFRLNQFQDVTSYLDRARLCSDETPELLADFWHDAVRYRLDMGGFRVRNKTTVTSLEGALMSARRALDSLAYGGDLNRNATQLLLEGWLLHAKGERAAGTKRLRLALSRMNVVPVTQRDPAREFEITYVLMCEGARAFGLPGSGRSLSLAGLVRSSPHAHLRHRAAAWLVAHGAGRSLIATLGKLRFYLQSHW